MEEVGIPWFPRMQNADDYIVHSTDTGFDLRSSYFCAFLMKTSSRKLKKVIKNEDQGR